ncbi:MAG: helicase-related protein [Syntrophales bacterium]|nr:helicase-related protein [Syntrophales bacterium]
MDFAVGSLVEARGREWVVLPESKDNLLVLRPLGGTDDEIAGIYLPLETVKPAQFDLPDPAQIGDHRSCRMLRDAVRLGFRASAGPFRSFAQLAVEPRPYQLVPLLMALRLDPVKMLIADDVGVGKTIEACLLARELLDRGEIQRIGVLCPPHLAEQWQKEMKDKFHINAELVLSSTARRLERNCGINQSIFEVYPHVIVSTDYIKSDRRRDEFIRTCPDLIIVDEAHTCTFADVNRGGRHQRYQLLKSISEKPDRHLILVTATPHTGKDDAFRHLLSFLNSDFSNLPEDLTGKEHESVRRNLSQYFVQRRRKDIEDYMEETTFPTRKEREETYTLSPEYKKLFDRALNYAREMVSTSDKSRIHQRVRWWSALALLRSLASSPDAAVATLRSRASTADADAIEDVDEIGRRTVLDMDGDEEAEMMDIAPGADVSEFSPDEKRERSRLLDMARQAEKLRGNKDEKLKKATGIIKELLKDGFHPIVFCRFIATAEYVANELRKSLSGVEVIAVTGKLPPKERELRVAKLGESKKRVLVCTDCLSEGINLQKKFDSVFHYDLTWNPTRHEQREGRVDRFGQGSKEVRVVTYYGTDNQIDGIVLEVLIKKHKKIRSSTGISVPVPVDTNQVIEAIFEGLLLREKQRQVTQEQLFLFEDLFKPQKEELYKEWENVSEREKRSHSMFAQRTIKVEEVAKELEAVREAIGSGVNVSSFLRQVLEAHGAVVKQQNNGVYEFDLTETPPGLRDVLPCPVKFKARFELPVHDDILYLNRTHPIVEAAASYVMDTALDPLSNCVAQRAGVIRTDLVKRRTTVMLVRFRYHIVTAYNEKEKTLLAEDCQTIAFAGAPNNAEWLPGNEVENLLGAKPDINIQPDVARHQLQRILDNFDELRPHLDEIAKIRGEELLNAHRRVRRASRIKNVRHRIEPKLPPDILGLYVYLPSPEGA